VERGRARLAELLESRGSRPRFFRFPFLREGETPEKLAAMRRYLESSGQRNLPVTLDTQDWSFEAPWVEAQRAGDTTALDSLASEYLSQLRLEVTDQEERGDRLLGRTTPQILLLHANAVGAAQWDALFAWLEGTGHRFATADEVLADSAFALPTTSSAATAAACGIACSTTAVARRRAPPSPRCSIVRQRLGIAAISRPSAAITPRMPCS